MKGKSLIKPFGNEEISPKEMKDLMYKLKDFYDKRPDELSIFRLADLILQRLRNDKDFFMSFEGMRGTGKSNALLLVMLTMCRSAGVYRNRLTGEVKRVNPRLYPLPPYWEQQSVSIRLDKNLSFLDESSQLQKKFNELDRFMPFGIDEGSKNLHKYNWQDKLQQKLIQMSDTERYQNKAFFICIPNFKELTTSFRNDRINMRIFLVVRHTKEGYTQAVISAKDESRWTDDPWHIDENKKKFEWLLRKTPVSRRNWQHILNAEKKLTGYLGTISFPSLKELSPRLWHLYYKHKTDNAQKEITPKDTKDTKQVQRYKFAVKQMIAFLKAHHKVSWTDLAKLTKLSGPSISRIWTEATDIEYEYRMLDEAKNDAAAIIDKKKKKK